MCGIVACRTQGAALGYLVPALRRLEYRGYDSAGVAVHADDGQLALLRAVGRLDSLEKVVAGYTGPALNGIGIGHTRWATHGRVSERNAHPHLDCTKRVAVVHNGIIENAAILRSQLEADGHVFRSDVDSEVVAHLIESALRPGGDLLEAVRVATHQMEGSWALAVLEQTTNRLVVAAHRSPLVVARSVHGDFAASDISAVLEWVDSVHVLRDGDIVELGVEHVWTGVHGPRSAPAPFITDWRSEDSALGSHKDYMLKEIGEQPAVAARLLDELASGVVSGALWNNLALPRLARVRVVACGTSLHAGMVISRVLQTVGGIPVALCTASENTEQVFEPGTLTIAISQSGETADVLRALESLPPRSPVLALTNTLHSTLARCADAVVSCSAGQEVGVAATKTFTAQVIAGVVVALSGLVASERLDHVTAGRYVAELSRLPGSLERAHRMAAQLSSDLAVELASATGFLFIARGAAVPYASEGALKLKEITYRWAQSYPAGELKHGPIALIEEGTPVVVVDDGHSKLAGNIAEIAARQARIISVGRRGSTIPVVESASAPWGPLESIVALQHFSRSIALALGRDVDKPRNLAKSVTVE